MEFIDGIIDKHTYLEIFKRNVKSLAKKLNLNINYIFGNDNDSINTVKICLYFIKNEGITRL